MFHVKRRLPMATHLPFKEKWTNRQRLAIYSAGQLLECPERAGEYGTATANGPWAGCGGVGRASQPAHCLLLITGAWKPA